jgi:hypothetical protein
LDHQTSQQVAQEPARQLDRLAGRQPASPLKRSREIEKANEYQFSAALKPDR